MRTNWKIVERDPRQGKWALMYVSLSPKGLISMSRFTWEKTGSPMAYLILFDEDNQRIGLKPAATGDTHAYPLLRRGQNNGKKINAFRMMIEHGIKLGHGIKFTDMEIDNEGVLILKLRTAKESGLSTGWDRRRESQMASKDLVEPESWRASPVDEACN